MLNEYYQCQHTNCACIDANGFCKLTKCSNPLYYKEMRKAQKDQGGKNEKSERSV